jgi:ActR/RegA family two-component response regulator
MAFRPRIIVATPHASECTFMTDWLSSEGFEPVRASNVARMTDEIKDRPFDLVVLDEGFAFNPDTQAINLVRARQAHAPIVVIGSPDAAVESQALSRGASYLARPVDRALLVCTVSMAVMESRPVRRSERKRARVEALVEGVPSEIIDVSREGLRLEVPRVRKAAPPPPVFSVRVPLLGVALLVRRMWTSATPQPNRPAAWYGGELAQNSRRVELAWTSLVDALPASRARLELH